MRSLKIDCSGPVSIMLDEEEEADPEEPPTKMKVQAGPSSSHSVKIKRYLLKLSPKDFYEKRVKPFISLQESKESRVGCSAE
jgi:hypothetical protein